MVPAPACSAPYPRWLWPAAGAVEFSGSGPSWPGWLRSLIGRQAETEDGLL